MKTKSAFITGILLALLLIISCSFISCDSGTEPDATVPEGEQTSVYINPTETSADITTVDAGATDAPSTDTPTSVTEPVTSPTDITTNAPETTSVQTVPADTTSATTPAQTEPAVTTPGTTAHIHSFGKEWKNDSGNHWHVCACGEKSDNAAHTFGEWVTTKQPTEKSKGSKYRICSVCGYKEESVIAELQHTHAFGTDWLSDNTNHWHICACGEKSGSAAHTFGEWIVDKEATCTEKGSRHHICKVCGKNVSEAISAKGHTDVIDKGTAATCLTDGLSDGQHCSICNSVIKAQAVIKAKGHTVVTQKAVSATCAAEGMTEGSTCSVCKTIIKAQEKIAALGHNFVDGKCTRCGAEKYSEGLTYEKTSDSKSWKVTGIGTCTDIDIVIPAKYQGLAVTEIGQKAFSECANIKSIAIPTSVKTIGTRAFYGCTGVTEITIPESVEEIGTQIFYKSGITKVYYNSSYGNTNNPFMSGVKEVIFGGKTVPSGIVTNNMTITILNDIKHSIEGENGKLHCRINANKIDVRSRIEFLICHYCYMVRNRNFHAAKAYPVFVISKSETMVEETLTGILVCTIKDFIVSNEFRR